MAKTGSGKKTAAGGGKARAVVVVKKEAGGGDADSAGKKGDKASKAKTTSGIFSKLSPFE